MRERTENRVAFRGVVLVVNFVLRLSLCPGCRGATRASARPCLLPGGGETTRTSVEVSHEHLADPPGGIPGAGGVVGKAEIPGGAARRMVPSLSFV